MHARSVANSVLGEGWDTQPIRILSEEKVENNYNKLLRQLLSDTLLLIFLPVD